MEFLIFLYQLLIMPLQIVFEVIYYLAFKLTGNFGISIIALSFGVSLLLVPLYARADAIQKEEREIAEKLAKGVAHIKKTFRGDEQLMMLQAYYRKNNYSPLYSLRSSLSLFLQIPFFVAAYQFLANLEILKGVSFGCIKDLAASDAMISLGDMTINVLPIVMTLVNLASTYFFTKGYPLKTKIQLNGMALFFLVFLYNSPSGLVFYWTLNNVFNFAKTMLKHMKNSEQIMRMCTVVVGLIVIVYSVFFMPNANTKKIVFCLCFALFINLPTIINLFYKDSDYEETEAVNGYSPKIFVVGCFFLSLLTGAVIPSSVIGASPQEFIIIGYFSNPLIYLINSFLVAFGTFVIWGSVFYWLASSKYKIIAERIVWFVCGIAIVNYMFFGRDLGILTATLQYENGMKFTKMERAINIAVIILLLAIFNLVWKHYKKFICDVLLIGSVALLAMLTVNASQVNESISRFLSKPIKVTGSNEILTLSRTGKNVIVFMLDRAMGTHVPYIFNENTKLKEQFSGFKHYANTVSFGGFTNFGTPSVFGGYEYTPLEMNKRDQERLVDKHNEAIKVMPVLFDENGFDVTVCNPPYANYQWIPDLSIYDEYTSIKTHLTIGKFGERDEEIANHEIVAMNNRNFYRYGVMKTFPLVLQKSLYDSGRYNEIRSDSQNQKVHSIYTATNTSKAFLKHYNVLKHLADMSKVIEGGNCFIMMKNDTTHEPCLLQLPDYVPAKKVDNTEYEKNNSRRFVLNGKKLKMENTNQVIHYHANMAALVQMGKWFDYMRENGVYDNTRIILVADHGRPLMQVDNLILDNGQDGLNNVEFYYPLLMVKDFGATKFTTSEEFMTNADVITIATKDIIRNPVNPFTKKLINNDAKKVGKQYILGSYHWDVNKNNGNTYLPGRWYSVHKDMREKENWEIVKENAVLPY